MESEACTIKLPSDHVLTLRRVALEHSGGSAGLRLTYATLVRAAVRLLVEQLQVNPRAALSLALHLSAQDTIDPPAPALSPSASPASGGSMALASSPASASSPATTGSPPAASSRPAARRSSKRPTSTSKKKAARRR